MEEQNKEEQVLSNKENTKKIKNLISAVILLSGLFVGSLFVDVVQLVQGSGFSKKNLNQADVFEAGEKTWVAFSEPGVTLKVVSEDDCTECDPSEALVWMRKVMPTLSAQKVDINSKEGQALKDEYELKSLPAFIFDDNVVKTDFYLQAQVLFEDKGDGYLFNVQELGLNPGKFLTTPEVKDGDIVLGNADSDKKVIVFSDFQCPYSKMFNDAFQYNLKEYGDRVEFVFKHLPLSFHPQAMNAALASECANEQGKFSDYSSKLFASQDEWGAKDGTSIFKAYANTLGLNYNQFSQCLDDEKYADKINADMEQATEFGISGTPAIFVGDQFQNGALSIPMLKNLIEEELSK